MFRVISIIKTIIKLLTGRGSFRSYGQYGEDAVLNSFFRNKKGFYVDVGAYHPVLYSNTYAFYKRGWRGIVIEPNPLSKPLFHFFRPRDIYVCAGVGEGKGQYVQHKDGAFNHFNKGDGGNLERLDAILDRHHVTSIDLLTIDVEGLDLEVLKTHNWSIKPKVIAVEASLHGEVQAFLEAKGYLLKGITGATLIFALST